VAAVASQRRDAGGRMARVRARRVVVLAVVARADGRGIRCSTPGHQARIGTDRTEGRTAGASRVCRCRDRDSRVGGVGV